MLSSGTVGACLEANIAGIPALALSQEFPRPIKREQWDLQKRFEDSIIEHLEQQNQRVLPTIYQTVVPSRITDAVTWSANVPFNVCDHFSVTDAYLGHAMYGSLFEKNGSHYNHRIHEIPTDPNDRSDIGVLKNGHVSLTRIDIRDIGRLSK